MRSALLAVLILAAGVALGAGGLLLYQRETQQAPAAQTSASDPSPLPAADPRGSAIECAQVPGPSSSEVGVDDSRCYQLERRVASPFSDPSQVACSGTNQGNGRLYQWTNAGAANVPGPLATVYVCRGQ